VADSATVLSGGSEIVRAHGTDDGAQIPGGKQFDFGVASGVTIFSSDSQIVESGGTASHTTVSSGGAEIVLSGGTAIGATIVSGGTVTVSSGGIFEFTSGTTGTPVVHAGATLEVGSGYVFGGTVGTGIKLEILSGGVGSGTTVSSGGSETVFASGITSDTAVLKGGTEIVSSGGTASGTTISGGTLEITSGGSVGGDVTFATSTGKLLLDVTTFSGTVAGMTAQDTLDLRDFKFAATHVASAVTATSATLTVTDGAEVATIILLGNYTASTFTKSNDGFGGTSIVDPPGNTSASLVSLAQTHKG
jgi:autotransporter passenger strand-loop-strand repeat protein